VPGQPDSLAKIDLAGLVQAGDHVHAAGGPGGQGGVFAVSAVAKQDVSFFQVFPELAEQAQVMLMQAACGHLENGPAGQ
jgi:hypothetical protein